MFSKRYKINLLFNASKVYDRRIVEGIGNYFQASQCDWDIFLEEDFRYRVSHIKDLSGDGIIADFDNPEVEEALKNVDMPVVGVGGSYHNPDEYPDVPYIATDNAALIQAAYAHLKDKGLQRFAFYGLPDQPYNRWAREREKAFRKLAGGDGYPHEVYRGHITTPENWQRTMDQLSEWLQTLHHPVGIIAATDARARHVLQLCDHLGIMVPDSICLIGIDDEELTQYLSRISLTSVRQGCPQIGFQAAKKLHSLLSGNDHSDDPPMLIAPNGVVERQSTDFKALQDPYVIKATHFIRRCACNGIKVSQVVDHVGISRSNLESRFVTEYGHSMHTELHLTKFNRAKNLLSTTNIPIAEIAGACGYPSIQYLYTVFKRNLDVTPKEFRCQRQQEDEPTDDQSSDTLQ